MARPALVFLCQRIPYPPVDGARITSYNLIRHLARQYRVFLGTFVDNPLDRAGIENLRAMVEEVHVDSIRKPWAFGRALPRWLSGEPLSFAVFRSRRLNRWLDRVEEQHKPIAIVTHSSNISAYAVDKFRRNGGKEPRRVLHFADMDSQKFVAYAQRARGLKRWFFNTEARRVRREEKRLTSLADAVAFVSDEEATLFRSALNSHQDRVVTLPNGVDTDIFNPECRKEASFQSHGACFMFTGAMDYPPNIEAVSWFAKEVFPHIRNVLPVAQFLIVGSRPAPRVQSLGKDPAVMVTGRVESVAAYLAHAQVAVAPLKFAPGIQNKVLEAMAMELPVVVSRGALAGITAKSGEHLLCAESKEEWVEACVDLVRNSEKARHMGREARKLVMENYNWEAQFARLDKILGSGKQDGQTNRSPST